MSFDEFKCLDWHKDQPISHGVAKSGHQDVLIVPSDYALAHCLLQSSRCQEETRGSSGVSSEESEIPNAIGPWLGKPSTYSRRLGLSIKISKKILYRRLGVFCSFQIIIKVVQLVIKIVISQWLYNLSSYL